MPSSPTESYTDDDDARPHPQLCYEDGPCTTCRLRETVTLVTLLERAVETEEEGERLWYIDAAMRRLLPSPSYERHVDTCVISMDIGRNWWRERMERAQPPP